MIVSQGGLNTPIIPASSPAWLKCTVSIDDRSYYSYRLIDPLPQRRADSRLNTTWLSVNHAQNAFPLYLVSAIRNYMPLKTILSRTLGTLVTWDQGLTGPTHRGIFSGDMSTSEGPHTGMMLSCVNCEGHKRTPWHLENNLAMVVMVICFSGRSICWNWGVSIP